MSFPFGARPILRCELLVSGGLQIFCELFGWRDFSWKKAWIIDETHFIWMMTWIGEYFLGEKLQVWKFLWFDETGDLGEVDINHTSKPAEKRWSFGSCCDLVPKIQPGKKPMRISSQPPGKRVEVAPVNLVNCGWWLQTIRHIFSAEFWFEPHRRINPPTLKSPTSLGLIGERWSNYLKFALKTYSTICWWSSQKKAQWQFTSNDFFHWDVLGSEKMVQGATNYNLNIPSFSQGLITQLQTMYWHMGYRHKWMAKPSMSSMAASFSLLMVQISGFHQLRLVVYPIIYQGFSSIVVVWEFLNHQQYV